MMKVAPTIPSQTMKYGTVSIQTVGVFWLFDFDFINRCTFLLLCQRLQIKCAWIGNIQQKHLYESVMCCYDGMW